MNVMARVCALTLFVIVGTANAAEPSNSIYQLKIGLVTQSNKTTTLDAFKGQPTLITMFYGSCPNVCPLIIETLQGVDASLSPKERSGLRVLMVSIDPDRDTPAALTVVAKNHRIDLKRWTLARANPGDVRKLAAVLNIQYRKLPNGEFNHSSVITLIDSVGTSVTSTSRLGSPDADFVKATKATINSK